MNRRDFISKSVQAGVLAGSTLAFGKDFLFNKTFAQDKYDLVAIKGGEPAAMFDKAIASLGGMKNFVSRGKLNVDGVVRIKCCCARIQFFV